jgi:hypothetical protein
VGNVDVGLELRLGVELEHALADVDAQIGDAFEVGHDLEHQRDEAQVGRHGLPPGQDLQAQAIELDLHAVDDLVRRDGRSASLLSRSSRAWMLSPMMLSTWLPMTSKLLAQLAQLVLVFPVGVFASKHIACPCRYPKRPVM